MTWHESVFSFKATTEEFLNINSDLVRRIPYRQEVESVNVACLLDEYDRIHFLTDNERNYVLRISYDLEENMGAVSIISTDRETAEHQIKRTRAIVDNRTRLARQLAIAEASR